MSLLLLFQVPTVPVAQLPATGPVVIVPTVSLPQLLDRPPQAGRLKSPQSLPYAQIACRFLRRELSATTGGWLDVRQVDITIRGLKADIVQAAGAVLAVFNRFTVLSYPSGARFFKWWPSEEIKLEEDQDTAKGQDIWKATLTAEVTSIRGQ